jgi:hypothetical protein
MNIKVILVSSHSRQLAEKFPTFFASASVTRFQHFSRPENGSLCTSIEAFRIK